MHSSVPFIPLPIVLENTDPNQNRQNVLLFSFFLPKMDQLQNVPVSIKITGCHDTCLLKHCNPTIDENMRLFRNLLPSNQEKGAEQASRSQRTQPNTRRGGGRGIFWTATGRKRTTISEPFKRKSAGISPSSNRVTIQHKKCKSSKKTGLTVLVFQYCWPEFPDGGRGGGTTNACFRLCMPLLSSNSTMAWHTARIFLRAYMLRWQEHSKNIYTQKSFWQFLKDCNNPLFHRFLVEWLDFL